MSINIKKKALNVKNGDTYDNFDMFFLGDVGEAVDDWFEEHPEAVIPSPPTTDGTYVLQCVVTNGVTAFSWTSV